MRFRTLLGPILGITLLAGAAVAPASALETGYYSVPYGDELFHHLHTDVHVSTEPASFSTWQGDGSPVPRPAPVDYVRYPWSNQLFAVHFFGTSPDQWQWSGLAFDAWSRAGRPSPRAAGWVPSTFTQLESSDEIYVTSSVTGPTDLHKLTFEEWRAAGSPTPRKEPYGFYRYSFSPVITRMDNGYQYGSQVTYDRWVDYGRPTPRVLKNAPGEVVWKRAGSSQLYLDSPLVAFPGGHRLTFDEWTALGRPAPQIR